MSRLAKWLRGAGEQMTPVDRELARRNDALIAMRDGASPVRRLVVPGHCGECPAHIVRAEQPSGLYRERCRVNGSRIWPDDPERPTWCPMAKWAEESR